MFYEKRIGSIRELMDEASSLDADAGLRILGSYRGARCYVFVTRFGGRFTAMVYRREPGPRENVGSRVAVLETAKAEELEELFRTVTSGKVTAFTY